MSPAKTTASNGLRAWQVSALEAMSTWDSGPFLISAAPGAGKTRPSIELARDLQPGDYTLSVEVPPWKLDGRDFGHGATLRAGVRLDTGTTQ